MKEHPQANILRAIADGKTIEHRYKRVGWMSLSPSNALRHVLACGSGLRIKPETITINGHEVPCPVREPLEDGDKYWMPDVRYPDTYLYDTGTWYCCEIDVARLKNGIIHLTQEAAIAHAEALLSFTRSEK